MPESALQSLSPRMRAAADRILQRLKARGFTPTALQVEESKARIAVVQTAILKVTDQPDGYLEIDLSGERPSYNAAPARMTEAQIREALQWR